jgi:G3E family GTPase
VLVTVVSDLGGSTRLVAAIESLGEQAFGASIALVAEPGCVDGRPHVRLRKSVIAAGHSGETRLDLVEALRALGARRNPPSTVVVAVSAANTLDTVQTMLEEPVVRRQCVLDAVIAAVDARRLSTRIATAAPRFLDDERVAVWTADRIALAHSEQLTAEGLASVLDGLEAEVPGAVILAPAVAPVTADRVLGLDAWAGPHRFSSLDRFAAEHVLTLRAQVPLAATLVDEWSDMVRDELGPRLWRLQGRVALRGEPRPLDCIGIRSFVSGAPSRAAHAAAASTVTIVGQALPRELICSGFGSIAAD